MGTKKLFVRKRRAILLELQLLQVLTHTIDVPQPVFDVLLMLQFFIQYGRSHLVRRVVLTGCVVRYLFISPDGAAIG